MGGGRLSGDGLDLTHAALASILCWYLLSGEKGGKLRAGEDMAKGEFALPWAEDYGVTLNKALLTLLI